MPLSAEDWVWFSSTTTSALSGPAPAGAADDVAAAAGGEVSAGIAAPGAPVTGDIPGGDEDPAVSGAPQPATANATPAATAPSPPHQRIPSSRPQHSDHTGAHRRRAADRRSAVTTPNQPRTGAGQPTVPHTLWSPGRRHPSPFRHRRPGRCSGCAPALSAAPVGALVVRPGP